MEIIQSGPAAVSGIIILIFQNQIANTILRWTKWFGNLFCIRATILISESPKMAYAIQTLLEKKYENPKKILVTDGLFGPLYKIKNGNYNIQTKNGKFNIVIKKDKIIVSTNYSLTTSNLKKFLEKTYEKHNIVDKACMMITSENDRWSFPVFKKTRNIKVNEYMKHVLDDIANFKKDKTKKEYEKNGHPYRRGYILCGPPGKGKTTTIEKIAFDYNMSVYIITFNSSKMTDTTLINLINRVPQNSIIVIEEIDRQMKTIKKNKDKKLSLAGILSGLDGPTRLSNGTIIIMTTNSEEFVKKYTKKSLIREGRIDKVFYFNMKRYKWSKEIPNIESNKSVYLIGSWNNWDTETAIKMTRTDNDPNNWHAILDVASGEYEYNYFIEKNDFTGRDNKKIKWYQKNKKLDALYVPK